MNIKTRYWAKTKKKQTKHVLKEMKHLMFIKYFVDLFYLNLTELNSGMNHEISHCYKD